MTKPDHPEIGRDLRVADLKPHTIVWLQKEGNDAVVSTWVVDIQPDRVMFFLGETNMHFAAKVLPDGSITDNTGAAMAIYEYLGEP